MDETSIRDGPNAAAYYGNDSIFTAKTAFITGPRELSEIREFRLVVLVGWRMSFADFVSDTQWLAGNLSAERYSWRMRS